MDIRNHDTLDTINYLPIVQFNSLVATELETNAYVDDQDVIDSEEQYELNYCPLPPYCLIEDKHKYLAAQK